MADATASNNQQASAPPPLPTPPPPLPPPPPPLFAVVETPAPIVVQESSNTPPPVETTTPTPTPTPTTATLLSSEAPPSISNENNNQENSDRNSSLKQSPPPTKQPYILPTLKKFLDDEEEELHSASKWQEPWADDELTLYDIHREPLVCPAATQPSASTPSTTIKFPLKLLDPEFQCVICLQYMIDPMIVMDCLHRFCGECIQKCLRLGAKRNECPTCRAPIPSRRSLRRDYKWNALIQHVIAKNQPKQQEYDEQQKQGAAVAGVGGSGGQAKRRLSADQDSTHATNDAASSSTSLPPPQRKRARNLQDAIVEKQKAIQLRKQLEATQFRQQRQLGKTPQHPAAMESTETNQSVTDDSTITTTPLNQQPSIAIRHDLMLGLKESTVKTIATTPTVAFAAENDEPSTARGSRLEKQELQSGSKQSLPTSSSSSSIQLHLEVSPLIDIQLVRHVQERIVQPLIRPFLTLHGDATIAVLQQFLSTKLSFPRADSFQIIGVVNKKPVRFNRHMTLFQVREASQRSKAQPRSNPKQSPSPSKPLVLHYRLHISALKKPHVLPYSIGAVTHAPVPAASTATVWHPSIALPTTLTNAPRAPSRQRASSPPKAPPRQKPSGTQKKTGQKTSSPTPKAPVHRLDVAIPTTLTNAPRAPTRQPTSPPLAATHTTVAASPRAPTRQPKSPTPPPPLAATQPTQVAIATVSVPSPIKARNDMLPSSLTQNDSSATALANASVPSPKIASRDMTSSSLPSAQDAALPNVAITTQSAAASLSLPQPASNHDRPRLPPSLSLHGGTTTSKSGTQGGAPSEHTKVFEWPTSSETAPPMASPAITASTTAQDILDRCDVDF